MSTVGRRGVEPDPGSALDQAQFRRCLQELMRWAGYTSLQQLEAGAMRCGVSMPVSTANRALNTDRLPTADFVRRFVVACAGDDAKWSRARENLADREYARCPPEVVHSEPSLSQPASRDGRDGEVVDTCPYLGLAAFEPDQAQWFFGRERVTAEVVSRLTERLEGTGPLVVAAPSGAGKSSLLRAGLLSALSAGRIPGSRSWPYLLFTPTADPLRELATQVATLAGIQINTVCAELEADPGRLIEILRGVVTVASGGQPLETARVVLVVDQFEETFTLCADKRRRQVFIRALCAAVSSVEGRAPAALAVLGMRADFYGHCADHPELVDALRHGQVLLGAMDTAELRDAIEKPARAIGMDVQPGLVELMLGDLGIDASHAAGVATYEPGALPLLSHALRATWQQRDGHTLTVSGYRLTGGIHGAIADTAERAYRKLDPAGQHIARQLLMRMIQIGDGAHDTRRQLDRARLTDDVADLVAAQAVLDVLTQSRLITLHATTAEITHEALLRAWPRLRDWIETDRVGLLIHQRLTEAAETWDREGRHSAGLYQGPRLAAVRDWMDTADPDLTPLADAFLSACTQRERDEQRAGRRRTRRLRQLVAGLGVLLLLATTTTILAVQARNDAIQGRNEGISRKVADQAIALRTINPALAVQLSLAAFLLSPTAEARGALISSLVTPDPIHLTVGNDIDAVRSVAFSPQGGVLASGGHDNAVHLWNVADSPTLSELAVLRGHQDAVRSVTFSPDGKILATASSDRTAKLWDVSDLSHPRQLVTLSHQASVWGVAFRPDGKILATANSDGTARLWDVTNSSYPRELTPLIGHQQDVYGVEFSPNGDILATAGRDRTAKLWDVSNLSHPRELATLTRHAGFVFVAAFSGDGRVLATASSDMIVWLWDVSDPRQPRELAPLPGHTAPVYGLAFSPDGHTLATASVDTTARLWDVSDPVHPSVLAASLVGHTDNVYSVAFSPDRHTLATASHDRTVRLWETDVNRIATRICAIAHPTITRNEWRYYFPDLPYLPPGAILKTCG
ncbi:MAG: WD40 repeat domain-containing protein [Pseudonocardia sp.]|nr:WD40 repeat domain-containing protein [Pseudonocardia sp.]